MRVARTNKELIEALGVETLSLMVERRLWRLAGPPPMGAVEAVRQDMCDPIRLFVKNELHSIDKVETGRFRLIASVSLIDQLVERVLFSEQNKLEIDNWATTPSKPGLGLHDEGLEILQANMAEFKRPVETDVSGFDWSVKGWALHLDAVARLRLAGYATPIRYSATYEYSNAEKIVLNRVACLASSVLVTSDGGVFAQARPGIQKSGSYNTSSSNSRMRWMMAMLAGAEKAMCMGDDCIEEFCDGAFEVYQNLGLLIKSYEEGSLEQGLSFCSHTFQEGRMARPERWARLTAGLLAKKPANLEHALELLTALSNDLRHSEMLHYALDLIVSSGWGPTQNQ